MGIRSLLTSSTLEARRHREHRRQSRARVLAAATSAVETLEHRTLFASYAVVDLGTLGGPRSEGMAINASGQVAVKSDSAAPVGGSSADRAGRYNGTALTDIGTLGGP